MKLTNKQLAEVLFDAVEKEKNKNEISDSFVKLLAERQELHRISNIILAFEQIWKKHYGIANVTIETAYPLSVEIKKRLEKIAPGAEIKEIVNKELIGGAKIRVDDKIIDGSVSCQLEQLKTHFIA